MEQDIRFCELDGSRIAYATLGEGPLLLFGGRWVTHLEEEWDDPRARRFFEHLADTHPRRALRPDRRGPLGTSAARPRDDGARRADARGGARAVGGEPAIVFACSCAGLATAEYASRKPERAAIVFFGGYASRTTFRRRRAARSWTSSARTGLWRRRCSRACSRRAAAETRSPLSSRYQRRSADAEVAAAFLELDLASDARARPPDLTMPSLVLHRRGDRTVPIGRGRELAALLPNARFVTLSGDSHLPSPRRSARAPARARRLSRGPDSGGANGDSPLSRRETEVLRLVAAGLSNREIASSLVLSEHTVHRHVANILRKLAQSTRAAAAAHATRAGLI